MKKAFIICLTILTQVILAYDICKPRLAFSTIAESECYRLKQTLDSSQETFTLSAVKLTQDKESMGGKDNIILVPGGPGGDSQGLALSLNQKSIMDALWRHLNLNVVLFDPRGTGNSQLNRSAEFYDQSVFSTDNQLRDFKLLVDAVSPTKPVYLFAHSAGGNTAAKFAAMYPERVKGLILYSASIDTREIGQSNLGIFSQEFDYWKKYLNEKCTPQKALALQSKQEEIETFLRGVLKLQRLSHVRPARLQNGFYLKNFRVELIKSIENDSACNSRVELTLKKWNHKIESLPIEVKEQVTLAMSLTNNPRTHTPPLIKRGTWIKTAVICSEGLTENEFSSALWLDGLNFEHDTCFNVSPIYQNPPSRDWLSSITAPTILIGGTEDAFQIPSAVKRNAKAINNSQLFMLEGGGHESHLSHTVKFFKILDNFIN